MCTSVCVNKQNVCFASHHSIFIDGDALVLLFITLLCCIAVYCVQLEQALPLNPLLLVPMLKELTRLMPWI